MAPDKASEIIAKVKCSNCSEILQGFLYLCTTGHNICSKCKNKQTQCVQCNGGITNIRNPVLESLIRFFKLPCPYFDGGCEQIFDEDNMAEHKQRCRYRPYKCFFCEGNDVWNGSLNTFEEHLRNSHNKYWLNKRTRRNNQVLLDSYKDIEGYCLIDGNIFYFHQ
ncbi:Seven in absentia protein family [Popillia japonica]|uniref:RING-type E3 ubiquitin transferase n=1 Tax=Popillia japonica TaxID=7064 RepID=A0AAW1KQQ5_POPJA